MFSVAEMRVTLALRSSIMVTASSKRLRLRRESLYTMTQSTSPRVWRRSSMAWNSGRLTVLVPLRPSSTYSSTMVMPSCLALARQILRWVGMERPSGS